MIEKSLKFRNSKDILSKDEFLEMNTVAAHGLTCFLHA